MPADADNKKGKRNKKESQLVIRLEKDMRDRFVAACQDLDSTAARELRRHIKRFLRRYERGEFNED